MNRQTFLNRLRNGLAGLPPKTVDDLAADYEAHFADGAAAGRGETEVADALGDPDRIARELRAEAGLKRWEAERNPSAAVSAVFAVLGLGAIDILVLLPILMGIAGGLFGVLVAAVVCLAAGAVFTVAGPFWVVGAPTFAIVLAGLGLMFSASCVGLVTTIISIGFVNVLVWYGRLHLRLLKPALEPQGSAT
jgi:uncharacterized membrane protein